MFCAAVDAMMVVDERKIVVGWNERDCEGGGARFYGDFLVKTEEVGRGKVIKVNGVKMESPSLPEIYNASKKLGLAIEKDGEITTDVSYSLFEEFLSHVACGWSLLYKSFKKYSCEMCLELVVLANAWGATALKRAYARCAYERVERANVVKVLGVAMDEKEPWLAKIAFRCIAKDFEGVVQGSRGGELKREVERFLKVLLAS